MPNKITIYPVPWDLTTTNITGTAYAPSNINAIMHQLDHTHPFITKKFVTTVAPENKIIRQLQNQQEQASRAIISRLNNGEVLSNEQIQQRHDINNACDIMHQTVHDDCNQINDPIILCGGEHGVGLGYLKALSKKHTSFGILQIDAHMDCRVDYYGFTSSHASAITRYSKLTSVSSITQVGIRDYDSEELQFQKNATANFYVFKDYDSHKKIFQGITWHQQCTDIINTLPEYVFISVDIDGLEPSNGPATGTPVNGGLTYNQWVYLMELVYKNKTIIGAELVEVGNNPTIDALFGARMIQVLSGMLSGESSDK